MSTPTGDQGKGPDLSRTEDRPPAGTRAWHPVRRDGTPMTEPADARDERYRVARVEAWGA